MIFSRKKDSSVPPAARPRALIISGAEELDEALLRGLVDSLLAHTPDVDVLASPAADLAGVDFLVSAFQPPAVLSAALASLLQERARRKDGYPVFIVLQRLGTLTSLGAWLVEQAEALEGMRLIVEGDTLIEQFRSLLGPCLGPNVIKMPVAPEVQGSPNKYFFVFSPQLHRAVQLMGELAENNMSRVYLLGAPGTGKTSLAYYFYLKRGKGNFVTVNLSAENTGDKSAIKSLLCGHVTGAIPGAPSREGALSFSRDGVCFLDESHSAAGAVMQVLMEVLESGQFLPYGATAKRFLDCAVIFASNRSWEALRSMLHLDEHARLGATIVCIPDLAAREEDKIAVAAATLESFRAKCTTWKAPEGLSREAWQKIQACPFRGNTRTLIRVLEAACVNFASNRAAGKLLEASHLEEGLTLWEPHTAHADDTLYAHYAG